jgi:hypothetical protein
MRETSFLESSGTSWAHSEGLVSAQGFHCGPELDPREPIAELKLHQDGPIKFQKKTELRFIRETSVLEVSGISWAHSEGLFGAQGLHCGPKLDPCEPIAGLKLHQYGPI